MAFTAIQTSRLSPASRAWHDSNARPTPSLFHFDKYPRLVSTVDELLPRTDKTVLMGGGRGYLGALLGGRRPGMRFVNLDVAPIADPFVPTMQWNMEHPIPRELVATPGERISVITPFSMEYTDIGKSTDAIAQLLRTGEVLVWICHHKYSPITQTMRSGIDAGYVIETALSDAIGSPTTEWLGIARKTEQLVMAAFHMSVNISIADMRTERDILTVIEAYLKKEPGKLVDALRAVIALIHGARKPTARDMILDIIEDKVRGFRAHREMLGSMVEHAPVVAGEVISRMSSGFKPREAVKIEQKFTNLRYDVFDEARDGITLPICFVMVFERI